MRRWRRAAAGGTRARNANARPCAVALLDPLLVLEPERLRAYQQQQHAHAAATILPAVTLAVPTRLLARLSSGVFALAEHDDPGSHWDFGEADDFFRYKFRGSHTVQSGFTSIVLAHELQALAAEARAPRKHAGDRSWLAFLQHVQSGSPWPAEGLPFLFAGRLVDCNSAGVYALERDGALVGLRVDSEYETAGE